MARPLVALTGATGFLGRRLAPALARAGARVRLLVRRDPIDAGWRDFEPEVVIGALGQPRALDALVDGVDGLVHAAALIKATSREAFFAVNARGAGELGQRLASRAPHAHGVLVSTLAAREPALSAYAASKAAGEAAFLEALGGQASVMRPTAVYGPGDRETFTLFRAAALSPILPVLSEDARLTLVHVDDLAEAIVRRVLGPPTGATEAVCDDRPQGYGWREILEALAAAAGSRPRLARTPPGLVRTAARLSGLGRIFGANPMLTPEKANELLHPDWSIAPGELATDRPGVRYDLAGGFADAADWYRTAGWLPHPRANCAPG